MNKNILLKIILLLTIVTLNAQSHSQIVSAYSNYFNLPREIFFIQTNKTNFKQGESVYFSVYVLNNKTREPFLETTNIYCGLYGSNGNQISRGIFYAENGIAMGKLSLDSLKSPGVFYLNATSNWAKNFKEDHSFNKKLYFQKNDNKENIESLKPTFFIKFVGEGGSLLSNTVNSIGFKIEDQFGKGYPLENGSILNDKNEVIQSTIGSNKFGIGKFNLELKNDSKYVAFFKLKNGTEIKQGLPQPKREGVTIMINSFSKDFINIKIQTNGETWPLIKDKIYNLAINRDDHIFLKEFTFDEKSKIFQYSKKDLLKGLNVITLFDPNGNPILERIFYNDASETLVNFNIKSINTDKDSTHIIINLPSNIKNSAQISISVLPTKSNSYNSSKSMISEYLLSSYLNSDIEQPSYYFKNNSLKSLYELDNLLLVEAKNKFEWKAIFNYSPKREYEFEKGFNIIGKLVNKELNSKSEILCYQNSISNAFFTEIKTDNTFNFKNIYITKGDSLNFTINDEKGHNLFPELSIEINPKIDKIHLFNLQKDNYKQDNYKEVQLNNDKPDLQQNINKLNEVTVIGKSGKGRENKYNYQMPSTGVFEAKNISAQDIKNYGHLSNLIRKLGFKVKKITATNLILVLPKSTGWGSFAPIIIINGFRNNDGSVIEDYPLEAINSISSEGFGVSGSNGGTIYINFKNGVDEISLVKKIEKILSHYGFEKNENEYIPEKLPNDEHFQPDCIYWNGNLKTNKQGEIDINFPNFGISEFKIYVEGFTKNGNLISQELNTNTN